jgi:hypothetical protein
MESQSNDYRLERWLAVLLSLLFFLPFVARADDIVLANLSYHGDEMPHRDGEAFLALTPECVLVPVKIGVTTVHDDIIDADGESTGKSVSVPALEEGTVLIRGSRLVAGKVTPADPDFVELAPRSWQATIALGSAQSSLYYRCGDEECTLVVETGDVSQDLVTIPIQRRGREINTMDVEHTINFAGDLDHDGKLDLVANVPSHWNGLEMVLFLSSAARPGQLVGRTAELSMTGC